MKSCYLGASVSLICLAITAPAFAQESADTPSGDDIIVTAQRRQERLQDVPITITSLSSDALERANVDRLGDIVKLTPAIRFDYQSDFVQPTIRGVGNTVVTAGGGSNVGIYTDGFYSPNPLAGDFDLLNLQGIQVLKGPQGTLFGRNTTGGAILVTTKDPSTDTSGVVSASYGRFNTADLQAYVTTGLAEGIAVDLAASYRRSDGYARNIVAGPNHPGRYENWSVRAGLKMELSDRVSFLLRYQHQDEDTATNTAYGILVQDGVNYGGRLIVPNPASPGSFVVQPFPAAATPTGYLETAVNPGDQPQFLYKGDVFQLTGNFDLDFADLRSYTQYRHEDGTIFADQDQSALNLLYNRIPVLDRTFTQELLLTSKPGSRLQWTAGLFYFNFVDQFRNGGGPVVGSQNKNPATTLYTVATHARTQSIAAYADLTYELTNGLFLTAGARYSHDKFDRAVFTFNNFDIPRAPLSDDTVTPRAVLRYEINPNTSVYASYSRGYKAPIVDVLGGNNVASEKMTSYEIGFKHASRDLTFSLAAWNYEYKNLQVSVYENGLSKVLNAANARIRGIEGEVRYSVTPDFQISASAAYVDAKFKSFPSASNYVLCSDLPNVDLLNDCLLTAGYDDYKLVNVDASGFRMQRAPKFTASINANYGFDLAGGRTVLSSSFYHTSKIFFDAVEQFYQKGYNLVGVRAEWTDPSDRFTVAAYGDNIFGAKYYSQVIEHGAGMGTIWGAPETWGVSIKYKFGGR